MLRTPLLPLALVTSVLALASGCEKSSSPGSAAPDPAEGGNVTPPPDPTPTDPTAGAEERPLVVSEDHGLYGRYEGDGFPNDCEADADCHIGGCAREVCTAASEVVTTCTIPPAPLPPGSSCGCVARECRWWNPDGATLAEPDQPGAPPSTADCGGQTCEPPATCMEYYGIAGPRGPKLHSCEIPCNPGKGDCPRGKKCTTIADGPGNVCR